VRTTREKDNSDPIEEFQIFICPSPHFTERRKVRISAEKNADAMNLSRRAELGSPVIKNREN